MKYRPIIHRGAQHHAKRAPLPSVNAPSDLLIKSTSPTMVRIERQPNADVSCRVRASIGRYFALGCSEDDALLGLFMKVATKNQNLVMLP